MFKNRVMIYQSAKDKARTDRKFCVYWMQQSQRTHYNHALEYAIEVANRLDLFLVVYFGLTTNYPEANLRHYGFMMEGLSEVVKDLDDKGIGWVIADASPEIGIIPLLADTEVLVMDKGYMGIQRIWRKDVINKTKDAGVSGIYEVESDLIVPIETASDKEEYAARTIRPKIMKKLNDYARPIESKILRKSWIKEEENYLKKQYPLFKGEESFNWKDYLEASPVSKEIGYSPVYKGGYSQAIICLEAFMEEGLYHYDDSNTPAKDYTSKMSLYLHFGQISSLEIYIRIMDYASVNPVSQKALDGYIEQLVVRRELAFNYCYYRKGYDRFETMTYPWAYDSMKVHELDYRPIVYSLEILEAYDTHDPYWNVSMKEMVETGYMHNYMRMYWCKKIIEWSPSHEIAYQWAIYLNNKYFIDGRDANSYVGVAWCFGLHDHGWKEREIFGKLRYMNDKGLRRKFDMEAYIERINELTNSGSLQLKIDG